jgi:DNA gyrase subunit B
MAVTDDRYGADEIQVLEGLEPVRLRPGMYVGGTGQRALHHLVWEVVDNAVDEALAGHCTTIGVEVDADGVVTVRDDGRGIPVGVNRQTGVSALELVFTRLHAGGKFGAGGYKVSGGLHGVGASVTNALSAWLEVEVGARGTCGVSATSAACASRTWSASARWRRRKEPGRPCAGARTTPSSTPEPTSRPQPSAARLREKAYLVRGLEFRLRLPGHDEQVFRSERGLADYVRELNEEREAVHPNVVSLYAPQADVPTEVALGWTTSSEERVYSFCNVVNTVDGGTHVSGLRRALTRCLNLYAWETGRLKRDRGESLEPKDVFEGLTAALSVMLENPQFEGQTKGRLNNGDAQARCRPSRSPPSPSGWRPRSTPRRRGPSSSGASSAARSVWPKGRISKKLRNAATSIFSDSNLPGKLADTLDNPAVAIDDRELFVVEGDSAGGSAKAARDASTQAILPIRGKILNVLGAKNGRAFDNAEVDNILVALGGRKDAIGKAVVATLEPSMRRYGKVVITATPTPTAPTSRTCSSRCSTSCSPASSPRAGCSWPARRSTVWRSPTRATSTCTRTGSSRPRSSAPDGPVSTSPASRGSAR